MSLPYISIDNFRAFKEKCEFEFAPVTILTGTNSSGKSSLVDALRILQSYTGDIPDPDSNKFWSKVINFKDDHFHKRITNFKDLVNYHTGKDSISFEFKCKFIGMLEMVTLCLEFKQKNGTGIYGILKSLRYKSDEGNMFFNMEFRDQDVVHLDVDYGYLYRKFYEEVSTGIELYDAIEDAMPDNSPNSLYLQTMGPGTELFKKFRITYNQYEKIKKDFKDDTPFYYKIGVEHTKKEQSLLFETLKNKFSVDIVDSSHSNWEEIISWFFNDPVFTVLFANKVDFPFTYDNAGIQGFLERYFGPEHMDTNGELSFIITDLGHLFYDKFVYENILNALFALKENFKLNYISSIRNSPDRIYRKEGQASFGNLLSEFLEKSPQTNEKVNQFLSKYLVYFDIGQEINIERNSDGVYNIHAYRQGKKINLIDLGFGISQIMPILLQILVTAFDGNVNSIIIEEPETNLHPALQSKLADMVIDANKVFGIRFIIETHSEYLIRKLQYLTAKGEIKPEDTQIYYFYHPDNIPDGESQVKKININEEGRISEEFGTGFFDEADKIAMSIWSMNQSQKN